MRPDDPGTTSEQYLALQEIADKITALKQEIFKDNTLDITIPEAYQKKEILSAWADTAYDFVIQARNVYAYHQGRVEAIGTEDVLKKANDKQLNNESLTTLKAATYLLVRRVMQENFPITKNFGYQASNIDNMIEAQCRYVLNFGREEIKDLAQSFQPPTPPRP